MEKLVLHVKATNNYPPGLSRHTFELLSPVWTGPSLTLTCRLATDATPTQHEVTGWTAVFRLGPYLVQVAKVRTPTGKVGYLIYGGSAGLRVLDPNERQPPSGDEYLPSGHGLPFLWIPLEQKEYLPAEVHQTVH